MKDFAKQDSLSAPVAKGLIAELISPPNYRGATPLCDL